MEQIQSRLYTERQHEEILTHCDVSDTAFGALDVDSILFESRARGWGLNKVPIYLKRKNQKVHPGSRFGVNG